jgi:DNA-binding NarL/FixJ family response regulator
MKILVIDDHSAMCDAIAEKIERDFSKIGQEVVSAIAAYTMAEAKEHLLNDRRPDLILLDLTLTGSNGLETIQTFKDLQKETGTDTVPVAIFSGVNFFDPKGITLLRDALRDFGIKGVIPKNGGANRLLIGLSRLLEGETWIPDELMKALINFSEPVGNLAPLERRGLTPREWDVANFLAKGLPDRKIAAQLKVTPGYVRQVVVNILSKLGVENRTQAANVVNKMQASSAS